MIIKCGRKEFEVNSSDLVMYNGACYQLVTKRISKGWHEWPPIIAKRTAAKMIKDGIMVLKNEKLDGSMRLQYYGFKENTQ